MSVFRKAAVSVVVLALVGTVTACAGSEMRGKIGELERTIEGLQRDLALTRTRLDDMANQVALLTVRPAKRGAADVVRREETMRGGNVEAAARDSALKSAMGVGGAGTVDEERIRALAVEKVRRRARVSLGPEPSVRPEPSDAARDENTADEERPSTSKPTADPREAAPKPRLSGVPERRGAGVTATARERSSDSTAQKSYAAARKLFESRRYLDAISAFTDITQRHADHPLAENATFWIGAAYYERAEYALALREFERALSDYPRGRKAADAIYRAGLCHLKLRATAAARARFLAVVDRFPSSDAARDARRVLGEMGKE